MDFLSEFWDKIVSVSERPPLWMVAVSFGIAIILTVTPLWRITRHAITVVHEGGHALTAVLWGRRVAGIKLHTDTSGVTISQGSPWGLGVIFTTAAGYTAPALLGLGVAYMVSIGLLYLATLILGVLMVLLFLSIRNLWGVIITAPLTIGFYYALQAAPEAQAFILTFISVFLTVASTRPIVELQRLRWRGEASESDADQLQKLTLIIPGIVWVAIFFIVSLAANALAFLFLFTPFIN